MTPGDAPPPALPAETMLRRFRPSWFFVFTQHRWLLIAALLAALLEAVNRAVPIHPAGWPTYGPLILAGALFSWWLIAAHLSWLSRTYEITSRRVRVSYGVLSRIQGDLPLEHLLHTTIARPFLQRVLGLGTLALASTASNRPAITLRVIRNPGAVLTMVQAAAAELAKRVLPPIAVVPATPPTMPPMPEARAQRGPTKPFAVIGLAGGIGAGKSEVAKILGDLGFVVVDSDKAAKAALDRPVVRDQLVRWWGRGVLDESGRVSRRAVADRIFSDPVERRRLEGLIHPLIAIDRNVAMEQAKREGKRGLVIDAPLLFEAELDRACDHVLFVDAPRAQRIARVRTRGWDEREFERREVAQWPLDRKRAESSGVIHNDLGTSALRERTIEALAKLGLQTRPFAAS